jgi:hypothetical protein
MDGKNFRNLKVWQLGIHKSGWRLGSADQVEAECGLGANRMRVA